MAEDKIQAFEYKNLALALLAGLGLGVFLYICGGVAQPVFPAVTPILAAALGFFVGAGTVLVSKM